MRVLTASTEIGQGTNTIFAQIAADALGLPPTRSRSRSRTRAVVPNSGPTVASRTCMVVGKLVEDAAVALRRLLTGAGLLERDVLRGRRSRAACRTYIAHASGR